MPRKTYLYDIRERLSKYIAPEHDKELSACDARELVRQLALSNSGMADICSIVFFSQPVACLVLTEKLEEIVDYRSAISTMTENLLRGDPTFVEVYEAEDAPRPILCYMVHHTERSDETEECFNAIIFPAEFPPIGAQVLVFPSDPTFPLRRQTPDGLCPVAIDEIKQGDMIDLLLRSLRAVLHPERFEVAPGSLVSVPGTDPPLDQEVMDRMKDLHAGRILCTEGDVPLHSIRAHDPYFCLEFASHIILDLKRAFQKAKRPRLLLYWDRDAFVMSDDYGAYLAYRLLQIDPVPCAILGDFPPDMARVERSGGWDLLPPVPVQRRTPPLRKLVPTSEVEEHIDSRLREIGRFDRRLNFFPSLVQAAAKLAFLLKKPDVKEKELHQFFQNHPEVIDATATEVLSEVRLGADYRIDMLLQHEVGTVKRTTLVEFENSKHLLFTVAGRPRAAVTHALQQVEDWIRWWRQHPDKLPSPIVSEYPPNGLVIIGRSTTLTPKEEGVLHHLNSTRAVSVYTYDMVLKRYENMLRAILNVQEPECPIG